MADKLYIFISMNICRIGGSEQYMFNKLRYLEQSGFDVFIFSGMWGEIQISEFNRFKDCIIPAVMYSPSLFKNKEVTLIIDKIAKKTHIMNYNECIIESDGIAEAQWGEILAQCYKKKHVLLNVQENHNYSPTEREFIRFKYNRREVSGIAKSSIKMMLNDESVTIYPWCVFSAHCNNVVADVPDEYSSMLWENAFTIGSIGRIEKPFVRKMIELLAIYFKKHDNEKFNLIFVGGEKQRGMLKQIKRQLGALSNVNVVLTGLLYPISRNLLQTIDFFISSAGSSVVSFYEKLPTLTVHPNTCEPAGIIGDSFVLNRDSMFNPIKGKSIIDFLDDFRAGKTNINYDVDYNKEEIERVMKRDFAIQLDNVYSSESQYDYYSISLIHNNSLKNIVYRIIGKTFGSYKLQKILDIYRTFINNR